MDWGGEGAGDGVAAEAIEAGAFVEEDAAVVGSGDAVVEEVVVAGGEVALALVLGAVCADADAVVGMAGGAAAVVVGDGIAQDGAAPDGADEFDAFAVVVVDMGIFDAAKGGVVEADAGELDGGRTVGEAVVAGDEVGAEFEVGLVGAATVAGDFAAGDAGAPGAVVEGDAFALVVEEAAILEGEASGAIVADAHFAVAGDGAVAQEDAAGGGVAGAEGGAVMCGVSELGIEVEGIDAGG